MQNSFKDAPIFTGCRARTGFGKLWKVMEIDNTIFQDLESFGKRDVFQIFHGKVLDFCVGKFAKFCFESLKMFGRTC